MNHAWELFLQNGRKESSGIDASAIIEVVDTAQGKGGFTYKELVTIRNTLSNRFKGYRTGPQYERGQLETILRCNAEICRLRSGDEMLKRRHNVLVYKYVIDTIVGNRSIAKEVGVSRDVLYRDLNYLYQGFALLCVGLPVILKGKTDGSHLMKLIMKKHPYLIQVEKLGGIERIFPRVLQNKIQESRALSVRLIRQYDGLCEIYGTYCSGSGNKVELKRWQRLQEISFGDGNSIKDIVAAGEDNHMRGYYKDIQVNADRLWELATELQRYQTI